MTDEKKTTMVVSGGQSFSAGGHTFGTSWVNDKVTSWRINNVEVSEAEFNGALRGIGHEVPRPRDPGQ